MTNNKDINENLETIKGEEVNNVEATATSVSASLAYGVRTVNSSRIDLVQGACSISAKNTSGSGPLGVQIIDPTWIDEAVKTWILGPGESINYFALSLPKNTYYLRLSCETKNAGGSGTLGQPKYV